MAQLNFPDPSTTQIYTEAGITWTWNNTLGVWSTENDVKAPDLNYTPAGGVTRSIQDRLSDYVSPMDYGAKGDGIADDTDALRQALETGRPVDGLGYTYKTTSNINITNLHSLKDCTITRPGLSSETAGHVLKVTGSNWLIDNVTFVYGDSPNRAKTGNNGGLFDYRGLFVTSSQNFTIRSCKFTGNGSGSHLYLFQSDHFNVEGCKVYDSQAYDASATDDLMHGILAAQCEEFSISNCIIRNLTHNKGGGYKNINNRGIAISQGEQYSITGCHVDFVGQGYDLTGSGPNKQWTISACTSNECADFGFKAANNASMGIISDCVAVRSGYCGFVVASDQMEDPYRNQFVTLNGCKAIETGYVTGRSWSNQVGFAVQNGQGGAEFLPWRVEMNNCSVIQETTPLPYAFNSSQRLQDIDPSATFGVPAVGTLTQNCNVYESIKGLVTNYYEGAAGPMACQLNLSSDISWSPGGWNLIPWNLEVEDPFNLHNNNKPDRIYIRDSGIYSVSLNVATLSSQPGNLFLRLGSNIGGELDGAFSAVQEVDQGLPSQVNLNWIGFLRNDQWIRSELFGVQTFIIDADRSSFGIIRIG